MSRISAIALAGVPPAGLGVYGRDVVLGEPFRWRAVNGSRADSAAQAQRARELGGGVWLWSGPESFAPSAWRATLARLASLAESYGAEGVIVDPESAWPGLARGARQRELAAFGEALRDLSSRMRVGITSYPSFPDLETLAEHAGSAVWGSPQIYGRTSLDPAAFAQWYSRWTGIFGATRVIPSIAGWASSDGIDTGPEYRAYLDSLPRASGAIVWPPQGNLPRHIAAELATYSPGGNAVASAGRALASFAARPVFMVAAVAAIAIIAGAVALARR